MSTRRDGIADQESEWARTYAEGERRRTAIMGSAVFLVIMVFALIMAFYFANMAAIAG